MQSFPHAPQLVGSALVSSSQPVFGLPSQSAHPASHAPSVQVPRSQLAPAWGKRQPVPQVPQWFVSLWRSAQAPAHEVSPLSQVTTHCPFWQLRSSWHVPQLPPQPSSPQTLPAQDGVQIVVDEVGMQLPARQLPPGQAAPSGFLPLHLPCLRVIQGEQDFCLLPFFLLACASAPRRLVRFRSRSPPRFRRLRPLPPFFASAKSKRASGPPRATPMRSRSRPRRERESVKERVRASKRESSVGDAPRQRPFNDLER